MMIRGNMKNWFMLVALVFVMVVAGEVWGIRDASAAAKPIKLRMMQPSEPRQNQLTPVHGYGGDSPLVPLSINLFEPLVQYTKKGPVPVLATKWEHSADLTKWRFYLRKGVKYHNGADFIARDVVEVAKWSLEEKKLSQLYPRVPVIEAVAVDDYTVDLIFETPQPLLLLYLRYFMIIPTSISRDNRKMAETHPIGTGPYRFVEWKKGLYIKLAKFEGYWGPKPQIDDVEIIFREEEAVRMAALMAKEVDWTSGLSLESGSQEPKGGIKLVNMASPETVWLRFDEHIQKEWTGVDPIFADKRLRLAIEYAIDRKALVSLYGGRATLSLGQFASPDEFGFNPNLKNRPYDLEKARALVREAGAVGKTITFVCSSDRWPKGREVAEAIAYMIEQTGIKVKLMLMPHSEARKYKHTEGANRKFMSDLLLGPADALLEVETVFFKMFGMGEGSYWSAISDPKPTAMDKEISAEVDYAKRGEKLANAWAYVYEEQCYYVPLFKLDYIWGLAQNLKWDLDIAGRPFIAHMRFTD